MEQDSHTVLWWGGCAAEACGQQQQAKGEGGADEILGDDGCVEFWEGGVEEESSEEWE